MRIDVLTAIFLMGIASYACRIGGYVLMRYVAITPRVEAWLRAMPMALMGAILGPAAVNGGVAEWIGLATAVLVTRFTRNDFLGAVLAAAAVAAVRLLER
ncbi:MAG: AzlD domain-containing protein [Candidatus Parcubacteria bacterium]|nr:AzlD domain-containing protein [Burkholderiales bacterium]